LDKITVITVCYNSASTIGDTLRSIASQSYKDLEHLVIDGGSTDGTLEIVRAWEGHRLRLVSEPDEGIYDAMNKGLALAAGGIVGFLNADDFYADQTVLEQIANVFQDEKVDACYADLVYVSQDNRRVVRYWESKPFTKGDFALGWCPAHPTFYVRKSVVDRNGCFDKSFRLAADAELMMRYLEREEIRSTYKPGVWVRMRLGGQTNQSLSNVVRQNKEVLRALRKNGVPFSTTLFAATKVANRVRQFFTGRVRRNE
jgi:glycosyltransferase involved in cell wall biosynthesis